MVPIMVHMIGPVSQHVFSQDIQCQAIPGQETKAKFSHSLMHWMKTGDKIRYNSKKKMLVAKQPGSGRNCGQRLPWHQAESAKIAWIVGCFKLEIWSFFDYIMHGSVINL
jgi:hypothetical protein